MMGNLQAWRAGRQAELELPSGLVVTVQRVSLLDLASQGRIPAPLVATVNKLIDSSTSGGGQISVRVEDLGEFGGVIGLVVRCAIVAPPVADQGDAEHLGMDELYMVDRLAVFNWANAEAAALAPFRAPAGQSVGNPLHGKRVRPPAERSARDRG